MKLINISNLFQQSSKIAFITKETKIEHIAFNYENTIENVLLPRIILSLLNGKRYFETWNFHHLQNDEIIELTNRLNVHLFRLIVDDRYDTRIEKESLIIIVEPLSNFSKISLKLYLDKKNTIMSL